jgi:CheY-like chemotaxis protein
MDQHILIVDDNAELLELYRDLLEPEGYRLTTLINTDNIILKLKELQPDIVLLDFILPGINGGELCHQIKNTPATAHIPVIFLTAHPRVLASLGNYGWDDFIAKPFDIQELHAVLRKYLIPSVA